MVHADEISKQTGAQILGAAMVASVAAELLSGEGEFNISGYMTQMLQVGGPVAVGAAVAALIGGGFKPGADDLMGRYLRRGAVTAVVATGISMYAGILPQTFDMATLNFGAVVIGSVYITDTIVGQMQKK